MATVLAPAGAHFQDHGAVRQGLHLFEKETFLVFQDPAVNGIQEYAYIFEFFRWPRTAEGHRGKRAQDPQVEFALKRIGPFPDGDL